MAYSVHFTDRTFIKVEDAQAQAIMKEQNATGNKREYVQVGKNQYKLASISKVEWIKEPLQADRQIEYGSRCHGEKSIHRVIYNKYKKELATKEQPRKWEEFREKAYDYYYSEQYSKNELNGAEPEWCDHRKGTCFCESKAVERVKEIMGGGEVIS